MRLLATLPLLMFALVAPNPVRAITMTLVSGRDTSIYSNSATRSAGQAGAMQVGRTAMGANLRRGLLWFDVSEVPSGANIQNATLTLYLDGVAQVEPLGTERQIGVYPLLADWGEAASGAGEGGAGSGGGYPAEPGDATWQHRFYETDSWTVAGGDYGLLASATLDVGTDLTSYSWSSSGLVSDVQSWIDSPSQNFGWILVGDELGNASVRRFLTREASDAEMRPMLLLEFTSTLPPLVVPEPNSGALLLLGRLLLAWRRFQLRCGTDGFLPRRIRTPAGVR